MERICGHGPGSHVAPERGTDRAGRSLAANGRLGLQRHDRRRGTERELFSRDSTRATEGLMTGIGSAATRKVMERLAGPSGGGGQTVGALSEIDSDGPPMRAQNATAELVERSVAVKYPLVSVYCEKIVNDFREKFRG